MNLTRDLIFLVLYLIGVFSIVYWRKQKKDPSLFFYGSTWTFTVILTYFVVLEIFYSTFYFLIPLLFFSIFAFSYFTEKRKYAEWSFIQCFPHQFRHLLVCLAV